MSAVAAAYPLIETTEPISIDLITWLANTLARISDHKITWLDDLHPLRWNR